jgi:Holliday junction DNA helicase RuvA
MFAFLRGSVAAKPTGRIVLDVNGVGYDVHVAAPVHRKLQQGTQATLLTYCHIREEAFTIFGFLRDEEKSLFEMLLSVSGVGPKVALAVLSAMNVSEFGRAVTEQDLTAFTRVSGVGKKGAQRIILEMKAKLGQDSDLSKILGEPGSGDEEEVRDDVIAALCALGCTLGEARKAAGKARKELGDSASDEDLVRAALRSMAKV